MNDNAQSGVIVKCPNCGQMNRVAKRSPDQKAICGKCKAELNTSIKATLYTPPPTSPAAIPLPASSFLNRFSGKGLVSKGAVIIVVVVICGIIWLAFKSHPVPSYPPQALPYDGAIQAYTSSERVATLEIRAAAGSHYLVKLVNASDKAPAMTIFVRSGSTVKVEVPLGAYELRYASGETWYGYQYRFGQDTAYSKADKLFDFHRTGSQIHGYTVTLYKVPHGNLHTSTINANQF